MNAAKNSQQISATAASDNKTGMNEEGKMNNENTNIQDLQLNTGNSGILNIKNTMRVLGGLALAGMVAMATTFGTVSADSPSASTNFVVHGPHQMDVEFLNNIGNAYVHLGPDVVSEARPSVSNSFVVHGPHEMDVDFLNKLGSGYVNLGPDIVTQTNASAYFNLGPDVVKQTENAYVQQSGAFLYRFHGPDTSEWMG